MNFLMADNTIILGHIVSKLPLGLPKLQNISLALH